MSHRGHKLSARPAAANQDQPKRPWDRLIDLLGETLIAVALVVAIIAAAIFYSAHEHAPWMPNPEMLKHMGWALAGLGLGAANLYLALTTRQLEQRIRKMPQLRQFIIFGRRWFVLLSISGVFFVLGIWSLWPVLRHYGLNPPPRRDASHFSPAGFQIATGLFCVLGGVGLLDWSLRMRFRDKKFRVQTVRLVSYALPVGMVVYGVLLLGAGLWLLFN